MFVCVCVWLVRWLFYILFLPLLHQFFLWRGQVWQGKLIASCIWVELRKPFGWLLLTFPNTGSIQTTFVNCLWTGFPLHFVCSILLYSLTLVETRYEMYTHKYILFTECSRTHFFTLHVQIHCGNSTHSQLTILTGGTEDSRGPRQCEGPATGWCQAAVR